MTAKMKANEALATALEHSVEVRSKFPKPADQALILMDKLQGLGFRIAKIPQPKPKPVGEFTCRYCGERIKSEDALQFCVQSGGGHRA